MWAEPYNPLYVWGSWFHQIRTPFIQGGASVQQGLSAAFWFLAYDWHRGAADKRYSIADVRDRQLSGISIIFNQESLVGVSPEAFERVQFEARICQPFRGKSI